MEGGEEGGAEGRRRDATRSGLTSRSDAVGSDLPSLPTLSISSSMMTGLQYPARRTACTTKPGIAPT